MKKFSADIFNVSQLPPDEQEELFWKMITEDDTQAPQVIEQFNQAGIPIPSIDRALEIFSTSFMVETDDSAISQFAKALKPFNISVSAIQSPYEGTLMVYLSTGEAITAEEFRWAENLGAWLDDPSVQHRSVRQQ